MAENVEIDARLVKAPCVRPYTAAYRDAVIALVLEIQNVEYRINLSLGEQPDLLSIDEAYTGTGGGFWVALAADQRVVGTLGLQVERGVDGALWGVMKKFFVHPDFRGRTIGVSEQLYSALLAHAQRTGLRGIVLDTPSVAERSHAFYRRVGFQVITSAQVPLIYHFPDRNSLLFRLDLAQSTS